MIQYFTPRAGPNHKPRALGSCFVRVRFLMILGLLDRFKSIIRWHKCFLRASLSRKVFPRFFITRFAKEKLS